MTISKELFDKRVEDARNHFLKKLDLVRTNYPSNQIIHALLTRYEVEVNTHINPCRIVIVLDNRLFLILRGDSFVGPYDKNGIVIRGWDVDPESQGSIKIYPEENITISRYSHIDKFLALI